MLFKSLLPTNITVAIRLQFSSKMRSIQNHLKNQRGIVSQLLLICAEEQAGFCATFCASGS